MKNFRLTKVTSQIASLFQVDRRIMLSVILFCFGYKHILRLLYEIIARVYRLVGTEKKDYNSSFFGYMEPVVHNIALFFPALYLVDILSIILAAFGIDGHIKVFVHALIKSIIPVVRSSFILRFRVEFQCSFVN